MENLKINQFFLVQTKEDQTEDDINKIFGIPRKVPNDIWPKRNQQYMHHLITIDVRNFNLPSTIEADVIIIFFYPLNRSENKQIDPFEAVYLHLDHSYLKNTPSFPKGYSPWWDNDAERIDVFTKGIPYSKTEIERISKQQIQNMSKQKEVTELPSPLDELRGTNSFIGGFPMWLQESDIPKNADGSDAFYLMMLNGYSDYTKSTPFEGLDLYIFLGNKGNIYTVAQR